MATSSLHAANLFNVNGLVAVITGGGSGIGRMIARALALNGAEKVYIVGRREAPLKETAASVDTKNIVPLTADVTSKADLKKVVDHIEHETGFVNVLIANSGIAGPQHALNKDASLQDYQTIMWDIDYDEFVRTFSVNTAGVWYTTVAFLDLLDKGNKKGNVEQKSQVIATSSIASFNRNAPGGLAYGQSKAALTHMMKQLATGLAPFGIRSNVLAPGLYETEMAAPIMAKTGGVFKRDLIPLERVGTEEDMAGVMLFLTSRAGAYLTGAVIITDGGRLSLMPATF